MQRSALAALGAISLIVSAAPARADDGGMIYYTAGGNLINPEPLNTVIQPAGFKAFDGWTWGQGAGLYVIFRRFLLGGELNGFWGQLRSSGSDHMKLDGGYGLLQLGYAIVATPTLQVYPYLGAGYGGLTVRSSQPLNGLLSVSQGGNQNLNTVSSGNFLLDLGIGATMTVPMSPDNSSGDARGPALAVRAGYLFALGTPQWSANELPVTGGPALNPGGLYVRLMLGFGSFQ